jgi:hypothetical protein
MTRVRSTTLLEAIFALKGNLTHGAAPPRRIFSGIEIAPFKNGVAAACCISADFEMAWGWRARGPEGARLMGELERRHVPIIVKLLEEYSVPITWATIGHLFLDSCTRSPKGCAHSTMPRPLSDGTWHGDWYGADPCTNVTDAPAWYGPDLVQQIIDSPVPHEVGSHSFSHINCQATYSSPEVVQSELDRCIDVMQPFGLKPRTFIFPRHQAEYSYMGLMAAAGITAVRHRDRRVRLSYPERLPSGVHRIYESMNLRVARHYEYLDKVKLFIAKAQERHAAYALWFHPSDPIEWFDPQLRAILAFLAGERDKGRLWIAKMHELAAYCEARERVSLMVDRQPDALSVTLQSSLDTFRFGVPELTLLLPPAPWKKATWQTPGEAERTLSLDVIKYRSSGVTINVPATAGRLRLAC